MQVHYRAFPASALPPYEGPASLRAAYINSLKVGPLALHAACTCHSLLTKLGGHVFLKRHPRGYAESELWWQEAAYICAGSSAAVMGMASVAQDELWKSVEDSNFGQYFRISESMNIAARREGRKQSVPLRLYIKSGSGKPPPSSLAAGRSRMRFLGVQLWDLQGLRYCVFLPISIALLHAPLLLLFITSGGGWGWIKDE